jgi:DNA polymerase I-like protein with 3'-5' exonuclease and polymerase domains
MERRSVEFRNLYTLHMADLLVLQEMEYNGLKYDVETSLEQEKQVRERVQIIEGLLHNRCRNTPINWDSGDDVSAYLYGGTIEIRRKLPAGVFKTGQKIGEVRYKWDVETHTIPRLVAPLEGSGLKKADKEKGTGPWSTAEDVLSQVKQAPEVKLLLERAKLMKLLDYLGGFPTLIVDNDWEVHTLHGQFNQTVARTGRLSSSKPNLQNLPDPILKLIKTNYSTESNKVII